MNLFNKKNYKFAFEMIKLREFFRLENKDNFHVAADILSKFIFLILQMEYFKENLEY